MTSGSTTGFHAPRWMRVTLLAITWFNLVSAAGGSIAVATGSLESLGLSRSLLEGSIFPDYLWPGVILGVVVGGTQLLPILAIRARLDVAWGLFATAGFGMMIWIFVETGVIRGLSALQFIYFGTGLAQCVLVMLVLGIWPRPLLRREGRG
ncbi:hypothetical protein [Homoserinibacter sp. GY 40078]|uniref:hypothetical protein n=1 Tax=Homoserinibacter sp. GY 40078 TaxID=2603275 RepID=UPI002107DCA5|nr:hypothetical protein [Homoserinibacter sp. GY 40078]